VDLNLQIRTNVVGSPFDFGLTKIAYYHNINIIQQYMPKLADQHWAPQRFSEYAPLQFNGLYPQQSIDLNYSEFCQIVGEGGL
jgi:hypothetical protein